MKIMYFMDNSCKLGGAAHTLLRQAEIMKQAGHQVVIVLDNITGTLCEAYKFFCLKNDLETRYLPLDVINQPEDIDILFILEHFNDTKKKIEEEAPDLLHSVQINSIVELAARELNIPHIMNIYPAISDFFKINYLDIFPKYHICDSQYYASIWEKYLHTESVCIRTAAGRGKAHANDLKGGHVLRCICVGTVYQGKNQLSVIRACHKAIQNGMAVRLLIYGNYAGNPYGEECVRYIQKHALEPYIELKGFCDDMPPIYQENDVLLCGSTRESYPNVISEAFANGVVVISTPVAGVPEVIKDRQNGYLCKGYTPDDIYEKIVELSEDIRNGTIRKIMQNADMTYERVHSPESITAELEQYYQCLLKNFKSKTIISIDFLKKCFEEIINKYSQNIDSFSDPKKVRRKLWYLYHIQEQIKRQITKGKRFYIWGTGKYGRCVYESVTVFFEDIEISGFIDSYKTGHYMGKVIYKPEEAIQSNENIVLVATVNGQTEIIGQLEQNRRKYMDDYYILSQRWW